MYTNLDWLDVVIPLADKVEAENNQLTQAEIEQINNEIKTK